MPTDIGRRESLLTPAQRNRSASAASAASLASNKSGASSSSVNTATSAAAGASAGAGAGTSLADVEARYRAESDMVKAAQEAINHRPNFAVDAIGDSEDEDEGNDEGAGGEGGDVMDEVCFCFLFMTLVEAREGDIFEERRS